MAAPTVGVWSNEDARKLIVAWLDSPQFSAEDRETMVSAWRLMDRAGASAAEDDLMVPLGVRMLLRPVL